MLQAFCVFHTGPLLLSCTPTSVPYPYFFAKFLGGIFCQDTVMAYNIVFNYLILINMSGTLLDITSRVLYSRHHINETWQNKSPEHILVVSLRVYAILPQHIAMDMSITSAKKAQLDMLIRILTFSKPDLLQLLHTIFKAASETKVATIRNPVHCCIFQTYSWRSKWKQMYFMSVACHEYIILLKIQHICHAVLCYWSFVILIESGLPSVLITTY